MTNDEALAITRKLIANRGIIQEPISEEYLQYLVQLIKKAERERRRKVLV